MEAHSQGHKDFRGVFRWKPVSAGIRHENSAALRGFKGLCVFSPVSCPRKPIDPARYISHAQLYRKCIRKVAAVVVNPAHGL
jgi:hypothetical protein